MPADRAAFREGCALRFRLACRDRLSAATARALPMPHAQSTALMQRLRRLLGARVHPARPPSLGHHTPTRSDAAFRPIVLPGGHARFRSIALPLIGVLVLVASWAVGVSYYFHHRSSAALFVAEQRARAERGASTVEASIQDDYRGVEQAARTLAERSDLVAALDRPDADDAVRIWAQRTRRLGGDVVAEIYNARGQLVDRVGDPGRYRLVGAHEAAIVRKALAGDDTFSAEEWLDGLNLRAVVPVHAGARVIGVVAAERRIGAEYVTRLASRVGLDIGLVARGRALVGSTSAEDPRWLEKIADRVAHGDGGTIALDGTLDVALKPLTLLSEPLAVAVLMPNDHAYSALSDSTDAFATVVLFAILATIAAGLYLTRYLIAPVKELTERAEELSLRFAGRPAVRRGDELDSLVGSFEAMTAALLSHSDRLARAHKSELQNSLELQHQYAQMRLLRGLAAAANEGDSVEETLERALREIGAYLDWPLGRVALLQEDVAAAQLPPRSIWFARDSERFGLFIDASNRTPIIPSPDHLIGRAYLSGTPHWVSDLSRMANWNRLVEALRCRIADGNRRSGHRAWPRHGVYRVLLRSPRRGDDRATRAARGDQRRTVARGRAAAGRTRSART